MKRKIKVYWHDAFRFSDLDDLDIVINNIMITEGYLIFDTKDFILLKKRSYYYIPKVLIIKIEDIK